MMRSSSTTTLSISNNTSGERNRNNNILLSFAIVTQQGNSSVPSNRMDTGYFSIYNYLLFFLSLSSNRVQKSLKDKVIDYNDEVNMGIEPGAGMSSPRLHLPKLADSYFNHYKQTMERLKIKKKGKGIQ